MRHALFVLLLSTLLSVAQSADRPVIAPGGRIILADGQELVLHTVRWPEGDTDDLLAGWYHVFGLGALTWDEDLLKVAGLPVDELLVVQGSALPAENAPARIWEKYEAARHAQSSARSTLASTTQRLRLTDAGSGQIYSYEIEGEIQADVQDGQLGLSGAFAGGGQWRIAALPGTPGPFTITIDGFSYTPANFDGFHSNTLFVSTSLGLFCASAGNSQNKPSANVIAVVDNRVVPLDGSDDAQMPSFVARPVPGHELVLSSRHGDVVCGEPDPAFWIYGDRFGPPMGDPYRPFLPTVADVRQQIELFTITPMQVAPGQSYRVRWRARNAAGCWVPASSTLPGWNGTKAVTGDETALLPHDAPDGPYTAALVCSEEVAAEARATIQVH